MNYLTYIIIGIGIIIFIAIIIRIQKYEFGAISEEYIEFSRFWFNSKLILDNSTINEICICTIQGRLTLYYFDTKYGEIKIKPDKIEEREIKNFAIRNNITLKHEEGFHGGGVETLYSSKKC
jgi:hypothetical protein